MCGRKRGEHANHIQISRQQSGAVRVRGAAGDCPRPRSVCRRRSQPQRPCKKVVSRGLSPCVQLMRIQNIHSMRSKHIHELRRMAEDGNVEAMWILGEAYCSGFFEIGDNVGQERVARNSRLACKWLLRASNKGCTGAMMSLASIYACRKRQKPANLRIALSLEKRAWNLGEILAANNIAITYSMMGRARQCFLWLEKYYLASGDGLLLSLALLSGYGTRSNPKRAKCILTKMLMNGFFQDEDDLKDAQSLLAKIDAGIIPHIASPISKTRITS